MCARMCVGMTVCVCFVNGGEHTHSDPISRLHYPDDSLGCVCVCVCVLVGACVFVCVCVCVDRSVGCMCMCV